LPTPEQFEEHPELLEWSWPPKGPSHVKQSLRVHAEGHKRAEEPSQHYQTKAIRFLCESGEYPSTQVPDVFHEEGCLAQAFRGGAVEPHHVLECINWDKVLLGIKPHSTPGVPLNRLAASNAAIISDHWSTVQTLVCERLLNIATYRGPIEAVALVRAGVRDPVKIFIKEEPHKRAKISGGKLRLIASVSLVDQIVERLIGGPQNNAEISCWKTCPSKPGVDLSDDGLLSLAEHFRNELKWGPILETDVSGWDWSVQAWELRADAECRRILAGAADGSVFDHYLKMQAQCVSASLFVTPDGDMIAQIDKGGQLSGSYWTSSTNSRMRVLASLVARLIAGHQLEGPIGVAAMGDDSTERAYSGIAEALGKLGHSVKFEKLNYTLAGISFCSHEWMETGLAKPETVWKTFFRFLCHPANSDHYPEWFAQLSWTLRHIEESRASKILGTAIACVGHAKEE
jgi:hypothetical protein